MKHVLLLIALTYPSSDTLFAADTPTSEDSFAVDVVIDVSRELRTIPRTVFGINVENMWNANGVWNPWKQAPNDELLGLTQSLGGSLFRFPGGTLGDFYDWKDGVGPRAQRPKKRPIPTEGDLQPNDFGTDESLDFAKRTGGNLLISVNAGTGNAEDAAEWVRYVRERAAMDAAHSVKWWEVGNELYHKGDDKNSSAALTPEQYAEKYLLFARAMRKADPLIRVGAIGLENYGPYQFNTNPKWNEKVLRLAGEEIDFFAIHNAYAPVGPPADADIQTVYRTMMGAPELIRANLHTVNDQIDKYGGKGAKTMSIAITEWGPLFDVRPDSPYVLHSKTLGSALFTASVLKVFIETPRVEVATFFKLSDLNYMGLVGVREGMPLADYLKFDKGTFRPTASYFAFQLIATRFEHTLVGCTAHSPTFDTQASGWTGAAKGVPYLDVAASRSADGKRLTILAINKHFDKPARATFKLEGMKVGANGRAWTLNGSGLDAHTGTGPIVIPGLNWGKQAEDKINPRFSKGGPAEVSVAESPVTDLGHSFTYEFPAHSVTIIELIAGK